MAEEYAACLERSGGFFAWEGKNQRENWRQQVASGETDSKCRREGSLLNHLEELLFREGLDVELPRLIVLGAGVLPDDDVIGLSADAA